MREADPETNVVPTRKVQFDFPTAYEETSIEGDKLWDALMPRE